jgi:hypothetical protein
MALMLTMAFVFVFVLCVLVTMTLHRPVAMLQGVEAIQLTPHQQVTGMWNMTIHWRGAPRRNIKKRSKVDEHDYGDGDGPFSLFGNDDHDATSLSRDMDDAKANTNSGAVAVHDVVSIPDSRDRGKKGSWFSSKLCAPRPRYKESFLLSIQPNGAFSICQNTPHAHNTPLEDDERGDGNERSSNGNYVLGKEKHTKNLLPAVPVVVSPSPPLIMSVPRIFLEGTWKLKSNPYCLTDCQYDELYLQTKSKVKLHYQHSKKQDNNNDNVNVNDDGAILNNIDNDCPNPSPWKETRSMKIYGQVRGGRFSCDAVRQLLGKSQGRDTARIRRGLLCVSVESTFTSTGNNRSTTSTISSSSNSTHDKHQQRQRQSVATTIAQDLVSTMFRPSSTPHRRRQQRVIGTFSAVPIKEAVPRLP